MDIQCYGNGAKLAENTMKPIYRLLTSLFVLLSVYVMSFAVLANTEGSNVAGTVLFAVGERSLFSSDGSHRSFHRGDEIFVGDTIETGSDGNVQIKMVDQGFLSVKPDSSVTIQAYSVNPDKVETERVKIILNSGILRSVTGEVGERQKQNFRLNTPIAAIGVRGTDFTVRTTDVLSQAVVISGGIALSPFVGDCSAGGFGACQGDQVRELYAEGGDQYLEVVKGAGSASLLQGKVQQLVPVLEEVFKQSSLGQRHSEPRNSANKPAGRGSDIESILQQAMDEEESLLRKEENHAEREAMLNDTDGDGLLDSQDVDRDNDRISNSLEARWLLNDLSPDTDGDGVWDADELIQSTNPLDSDSDGDGLADGVDDSPLSLDTVTVNGDIFELSDVVALSVDDGTVETLEQGTQLLLSVSLLSESKGIDLELAVGFDRETGAWFGEPGELRILSSLIGKNSWESINVHWVISLLSEGVLSREEVGKLVEVWQESPSVFFESKGAAVMFTPSSSVLGQGVYESHLNSDAGVLEGLYLDEERGVFTAYLAVEGDDVIEVRGRVDNGQLFGRNGDYSLQGGIAASGAASILLTAGEQARVLSFSLVESEHPSLETVFSTSHISENVEWGRWSDFAGLAGDELDQLRQEGGEILFNRHFALARNMETPFSMPETGKHSFVLQDYEAVHVVGDSIEPATVGHGSLQVEFPVNRFAMFMTVDAAGLSQTEALRAYGSIDSNGIALSDNVLSDTEVAGFFGVDALNASLLFEKALGVEEYISGASFWTQQ